MRSYPIKEEYINEIISCFDNFESETGKAPYRIDIPNYTICPLYMEKISKNGFVGSLYGISDIYACGEKIKASRRTKRGKYF